MVLKADQERVKTLLRDTITLLCRNGLTFKSKFSIEALIGVTLDDSDVFLVSINELIRSEKAHTKESSVSNSHRESDNNQKKSNRNIPDKEKQRETRDRDTWQHKRKRPEIKEEEETSEEDDDMDEPEEGEICMPYIQKQHMHMWDEEEDHGSTGYDDSSSQSFPPVGERMLPRLDNTQHMSPVKQARVQAQPRIPQRVVENADIVYIKEEPDDEESWPPPDDEDIDESELHPDGMFTNMTGMGNAGFDEEQNYHEEVDGENCFYAVCDYEEEYEMSQEISQEMTQDMSHDPGQMPSPQPSSAKKSRPSSSVQTMYFCQICGQSFGSLAAYNTHKDEHKGIFKFPCSECDKGYSTKAKLNTHMRHHTGERFLCTWCGKGFMSKTSLKRHAKAQHDYQM
ncbi:hypothetical protein LSH36_625g01004 [Paralvinella palmiformis]|uniref:C2H2-type domain-containing protein n=1 Tax=Paralvinella palmiformis TaxID=53620 RepID=A0AAD9J5T8_9ANNE|nr:hypothetical protein LSH36_625g01004 [Paralvinella palmiformis]